VTRGPEDTVFLLTDYGYEDEFAGVTRAVVLRWAPAAPVVDLTHGVPPFDVRAGAQILSRSVVYLGPGVVVAVVDPGVGSGRRAVAVSVAGRTESTRAGSAPAGPTSAGPTSAGRPGDGRPGDGPRYLVGPDNGLLGWAIDALGGARAAVALPAAAAVAEGGATFDGRDLFAPVAARLWLGAGLNDVGIPIDPEALVRLPAPRLKVEAGSVECEVQWVDRFGNAQLAAPAEDAGRAGIHEDVEISVEGSSRVGRRVGSFAALEGEEVGLLVDANGQLSLVCDRRSAATVLGVRAGDMVRLRPASPPRPPTGPEAAPPRPATPLRPGSP
jgi:hypothetical protein